MSSNNRIARNLSFRHLRAFVCVTRHGSFSRAAEELAISQPALTLTIRQFEDMVGVKLFTRTTRSVTPTPCGREFLPTVEKYLDDFEQSVMQIRARAREQENQVNIALLPSIAIRLMPHAIQEFGKSNPDIRLRLHDDNGRGVQAQVLSGEADFGLCNPWSPHPDLEFIPLLRDRVGLICHRNHALAQASEPLPWSSLDESEFIGMADDTAICRLTDNRDDLPESVRNSNQRVLTIAALVGLVERGDSVAALPALASPEYLNPALIYRDLIDPEIDREICLISLRGRPLSAAARAFHDFIQQEIARFCADFEPSRVRPVIPAN
ncbi:MAG: LysR family transcriptional regulator [Gammaproteobacteria bacterium]|nr:LysR family transcriptional regulator [Gammaproteobacteria bacterium]